MDTIVFVGARVKIYKIKTNYSIFVDSVDSVDIKRLLIFLHLKYFHILSPKNISIFNHFKQSSTNKNFLKMTKENFFFKIFILATKLNKSDRVKKVTC